MILQQFRSLLPTLLILTASTTVALYRGNIIASPLLIVIVFLLLFGTNLLQKQKNNLHWPTIWGLTVLTRLLFLLFPESDDIYRYIWEGLIQNEGFNPFLYAPNAPALAQIPFIHKEMINHPEFPTIYWPVAQLLFRFVTLFSLSPIVMKSALLLFDIGTMFLIWQLLSPQKKHMSLWYLFNPVVLFAIAGEGHLEIIPVFFIVLALYLHKKKHSSFVYISLGLAICTKVNYLLFLPLFISGANWKKSPLVLLPLLLFVPYISTDVNPLLVPFRFGGEFAWNGPLFTFLSLFLQNKSVYLLITTGLILCYTVTYLTAVSKEELLAKTAILFILFTPTLHYWYLLMLTPFLVFRRRDGWILLHATIFFVGFYFHTETSGLWKSLGTMQLLAFLIPLLFLIRQFLSQIKIENTQLSTGENLTIVIPILNEAERLKSKIALLKSRAPKAELLFVDGGSTDESVDIIKSHNGTLLTSPPGRGIQTATGVKAAGRKIVVVLHADTTPTVNILQRIEQAFASNTELIGGACGLSYDSQKGFFPLIEALNSLKVLLFGISFGDQMQFFRRDKAAKLVPEFLLMEDMELSMRMKALGETVYLPHGVEVSSRRWVKHGFTKNITTVLKLVLSFLFQRQLGTLDARCERFYRNYYGK